MKSVLISIRPEWVKKILDGEKTVEVRKTAPKLKPPFKCYIYCTLSGSNELFHESLNGDVAEWNRGKWADRKGNVVAEFVCDNILSTCGWRLTGDTGKCAPTTVSEKCLPFLSCLTLDELLEYAGKPTRILYGWYISDLKIYGKPKELCEFTKYSEDDIRPCRNGDECQYKYYDYSENCVACGIDFDGDACPFVKMQRPPQSWCYVEDMERGGENAADVR